MGFPCTATCPRRGRSQGLLPGIPVPMGEETPEGYVFNPLVLAFPSQSLASLQAATYPLEQRHEVETCKV